MRKMQSKMENSIIINISAIIALAFFFLFVNINWLKKDVKELQNEVNRNKQEAWKENWENTKRINSLEYRCKNKD
jgi:uncharacterized protein YoxC